MPARRLIWVWLIPGRSYSTGSSTVIILRSWRSICCSAAYRVVVLPDPVGPVTRIMPWGRDTSSSNSRLVLAAMPRSSVCSLPASLSSSRITTRSPWLEGMVEIRKSMLRPPRRTLMRPSWGRRRSAISNLDITLMREISSGAI